MIALNIQSFDTIQPALFPELAQELMLTQQALDNDLDQENELDETVNPIEDKRQLKLFP